MLCPDPASFGGTILRRRVQFLLVLVLWLGAPAPAPGQAVVPPGATYVEGPAAATVPGAAAATAARWRAGPDRTRPLRIAFAAPPDGQPRFWDEARRALDVWSRISRLPLRFELVDKTDGADVEFRWTERFPTSQAGATYRRLDQDGFIEHVAVVLARAHGDGTPMGPEFRRLVALHEVGHVLGLPHSENPGDVMHPGNRNLDVSPRDLRSLAILYDSYGRVD